MATIGMIAARQLCRKTMITRTTSSIASRSVSCTARHRFADEFGRVPDDPVFEARGEGLRGIRELGLHAFGGGERIGARTLGDAEDDGVGARQIGVHAIVAGAELDARNVAQASDRAGRRVGADDDVGELVGGLEAALSFDVELLRRARVVRRLADDAGGDLDVLAAKRADDLAGRQAERRCTAGIDPDAHRIVAGAENLHVADALDAGQPVADLGQRIIGDIAAIERAVRREDVDRHQPGRLLLADHDALPADFLRQARLGERDAVLDQHLRRIEVGSELESDGDRHPPVAGRLRRLVEHVVDAVDLLLDRSSDRVGDRLGRRAGIVGADRHGRRHDLRELRDRQPDIGEGADDRDDDRDDAGKDRAPDEEVAELHGVRLDYLAARVAWEALGRRGLRGLGSGGFGGTDLHHARLHLGARHGELDALDDDPVGAGQSGTDDAQVADERPGLDRLGRNRVVLADRQHDLACLVGADGRVRDEQGKRRPAVGEAHVAEHARRQEIVRVANDCARPDRARVLADAIVGEVERSAPIVAGLVLQPDLGHVAGGAFAAADAHPSGRAIPARRR